MRNCTLNVEYVDRLLKYFSEQYHDKIKFSPANKMSSGIAGALMVLDVCEKRLGIFSEDKDILVKYIIEENYSGEDSLYCDLIGNLWAFDKISLPKKTRMRVNKKISEMDLVLIEKLDKDEVEHFDLIYGTVGIGVYAISRSNCTVNHALVKSVYQNLIRRHSSDKTGIFWKTPSLPMSRRGKYFLREKLDLGMAHGNPGVMSLMSKLKLHGYDFDEKIDDVLDLQYRWILSTKNTSEEISLFGSTTDDNKARMGWCYGDISVALSLMHYYLASGRYDVRMEAMAIVDRTLVRKYEDCLLHGFGLCHGVFGLSELYRTMSDLFKNARYLEKSVSLINLESFSTDCPEEFYSVFNNHGSLLEGCSGIILPLAERCNFYTPNWRSMFLIDYKI